jgi:hypothetical protein
LADTCRETTTTPSPALPQRKLGLPDLRKIKRRPGQARGVWGGSTPSALEVRRSISAPDTHFPAIPVK